MILPELPEPLSADECASQANTYADALTNMPRLRQLARHWESDAKGELPDWFLGHLSEELDRVRWRIDSLRHWHRACDPRSYALDTRKEIFLVCHQLKLALRFYHPQPTDRQSIDSWLRSIAC